MPKAAKPSPEDDVEAHILLDLIAVEFETDPMSVQCFDERIVERVKACAAKWRKLANGRL